MLIKIKSISGISIVIPTYNRSSSLLNTINSILNQFFELPIEILIIDQNKDGYLEEYLPPEVIKKCKIIKQVKANVSYARNNGYFQSKYNLLFFVDDDIIVNEGTFNKVLEHFNDNNSIQCICPIIRNKNDNTTKNQTKENKISDNDLCLIRNPISAAIFIKKEVYLKTGGFDPYLFDFCKSTEDNEYFIRFYKHGFQVYCDPNIEVIHTEEIEGGCEIRQSNFLENRKKFIKGWIFRYKTHNGGDLRLKFSDHINLLRSVILNKNLFRYRISLSFRLLIFYFKALNLVQQEIRENQLEEYYANGWRTNHLNNEKY